MNYSNEICATLCYDIRVVDFLRHFDFKYERTSDFVDLIKTFYSNASLWKQSHRSLWNSMKKPPYVETLTKKGFGWTFNMLEDEKLLNFSK
jgi:hypothetical protein